MSLLLSTLHVLVLVCILLLISLSLLFSDIYWTGCWLWLDLLFMNQTYQNSFFSPRCSVLMCFASYLCYVLCSVDVHVVGVWQWVSVCLYGRLNVWVLVKYVSALLWGCTASVSHLLSPLSSACMLFLVCWASTPPPLCSMHAKPRATYVFSGTIWVLSSCWNLNTDLLLQLTTDSNINLLQILQLLAIALQKQTRVVYISVYHHHVNVWCERPQVIRLTKNKGT